MHKISIFLLFFFFGIMSGAEALGQISKMDILHRLIERELINEHEVDHQAGYSLNRVENQNFIPEVSLYDFVYFQMTLPPIKGHVRTAIYNDEIFILPYDFNLLLDETHVALSGASNIEMFFDAILKADDRIESIQEESISYLGREFTHHVISWEKSPGVTIKKKWSFWIHGHQLSVARVEVLDVLFPEGGPAHSAPSISIPGIGNVFYFNFSRTLADF